MARVLVTGASGFIGSALVPSLAQAGHHVTAASRRPNENSRCENVRNVILPDLSTDFDWTPFVANVDVVVHLAGIAHRTGHALTAYDNIIRHATASLVRDCHSQRVGRLIYMSSIGAQTGAAADHIVHENDEPKPITAYDKAKLDAEFEITRSDTSYTILRPVLVYGPGLKGNLRSLMRLASLPVPLPFGALRNRRSMLAIENLVSAILFCIEQPLTLNEIFIVADPEPILLTDIFRLASQARGRTLSLVPIPLAILRPLILTMGGQLLWDRLGRSLVASAAKLQSLGWCPSVSTESGLVVAFKDEVRR